MITTDGWCSWAKVVPGVADKVYSQPNSGIGFACHSIVGSEPANADGIPDRFFSKQRDALGNYTAYAAASVVFVLRYSGELIQMYPITASTWTSGGREANTSYIAMELEGGQFPNYGEPMTDAQVESFIRLIRDLEAFKGISYIPNVNMLQHKQIAAKYGYAPTACASDRYQRAWDLLLSPRLEEEMTEEEIKTLIAAEVAPLKAQLDRLNAAEQERWDLLHVASGPIEKTEIAHDTLDEVGQL